MFRSLRWRIAVPFTMLALAVVAGSTAYIAVFVRDWADNPGTPIASVTTRIVEVGSIAVGVLFLGCLALALWISAITARPIRQITNIARSIARGKMGERAYGKYTDEVGALASAFNQMAENLEARTQESVRRRDIIGAVVSIMDDAFLIANEQGIVMLANAPAERLFTTPASEITGRPFIEVVRDYELAQLLERALSTSKQQSGEVDLSIGKRRLRVVATPLSVGGEVTALIMIQDLTELHRLESVRREFVANVSHELRTPLSAIRAAVETLDNGALEDREAARDFLRRINMEVTEMTELVQGLLDLSRIESGRADFAMRAADIGPVITRTVERLALRAESKGLKLRTEIPQGLPPVRADQKALGTVLTNLIDNAIKFTPAKGDVSISASQLPDMIMVSVNDTGMGIYPDDLPHVFERFFKADRSRSGGGVGLGLALAKHIVLAHGGRIWVESQPGKGSTFFFTLPVSRDESGK